jgi:ATP-dependent Clp protease ATP-binding subunit ClpB
MSISLSHFTLKAEEALLKAQQMAAEGRQAKVEPEHLLLSLLEQNDPMIEFCLDKLQIENGVLQQKLQLQIRDFPKGQENSAQTFISRSLHGIILSAEKEATLLNETYTNVDHLLLGLLNFHEGFFRRDLEQSGCYSRSFEERIIGPLQSRTNHCSRQ